MSVITRLFKRLLIFSVTIILMGIITIAQGEKTNFSYSHGAIVRADTTLPQMAIIFTGGDYNDGGSYIRTVLHDKKVKASFFFTGDFYRNPENRALINNLKSDGQYLGPHSNKHLLYCSWEKRDSLLVTRQQFIDDMNANYQTMDSLFGIKRTNAKFFIPPYEWYNDSIATWASEIGLVLFNYTHGTISHTDYTSPDMSNYRSSETIWKNVIHYEQTAPHGFNGFILLIHLGVLPGRTDMFYHRLGDLIDYLRNRHYQLVRIDQLLGEN